MKLFKSLLVASLVLVGCTSKPAETIEESNPIKMLAPTGATALALVEQAGAQFNQVDFVTGSEAISAELVKPNPEYDVVIAPVNLGTKMIENGKSEYLLKAVITFGNLYLVGTDENALSNEGEFAAFGENSVPDVIFKNVVDVASITPNITYYSSAQDVQGILLSGKATSALLAEPAVTATIGKAKEQGIELKVIMDLQAAYQEKYKTANPGFPQAAIFVKKGSEAAAQLTLDQVEKFVNETVIASPEKLNELIEQVGPDVLGVPNGKIASATWGKQNIRYSQASELTEELTSLLSLFNIVYSDTMLSK